MDLLKCLLFKITRENLQDHKWNYKVDLQIYKRKVKLFNTTLLAPYLPDFPKKVINVILECLISMFGVNVWYQCLVSMFVVNVWYQCLVSVFDINAWCQCLVNVWCQCLSVPILPNRLHPVSATPGAMSDFHNSKREEITKQTSFFCSKISWLYICSFCFISENLQKKMWIW